MKKNRESQVYLRAFELDDYILTHKWRCDDEIQDLLGGNKYFVSSEREKQWIAEKTIGSNNELYLAICKKNNNEMIGYTGVKDIDRINRQALVHGLIIGDKKNRNLTYSTEALFLLLNYLFSEMGIHRVYGYWLEEHKSSLLFGKMLGFVKEGILRDAVFKNNRFHNLVLGSILEVDFENIKKRFL
jgi:[ribosomal protein S5]-alanine N-acetyltransferase